LDGNRSALISYSPWPNPCYVCFSGDQPAIRSSSKHNSLAGRPMRRNRKKIAGWRIKIAAQLLGTNHL
jgi:hypothetical protein